MINKDSVLPMDKVCRSCMTEVGEMRSVFEISTDSILLADMIMACTTVQVASGDGLPSLICPKCEEQLNTAYTFKQQCERTDAALREYTSQADSNQIKEENESLDIIVKPDIDMIDVFDDDRYSSDSQHSNYSTTVRKKRKIVSKLRNRQCRYCNKVLTTKEGLKLHERRHTGEKLKSCPICYANFAKNNHLMRHMQLHNKPTDEYKHTCSECGLGFTRAVHLLKHKRAHKVEQDSNNVEGESSNTAEETLAPVKTELEIDADDESEMPKLRSKKETEDKVHHCKVCNKLLTTAAGLQIHMRRHTGLNLSTCYVRS